MKTDSIFYQIFLKFPKSFFELIGEDSTQWENYEFSSREVKQLSFRLDGLYLPKKEENDLPLYLVEVQFQPDPTFYYRLFGEFFLFLKDYIPPHPWKVVVIYPSRKIELQQLIHFRNMLNLPEVTRIYLDELGESAKNSLGIGLINLVVESEEQAVPQAKGLIEKAQNQLTDERLQRQLIDLIERIIVYKFPQKNREEIEAMFNLSDLKQTKVYQEALAEGEDLGEQRGILQGRQQEGVNLVLRLLNSRLGKIPSSLIEQIRRLSIEQLENLGEALLDFGSEGDLIQWLEQNS